MGLLSNQMRAGAAGAAGGGADFYDYQIAHSVRNSFAQDGTILRTPGTPSSTTTMTLSMWVQRQTSFPYADGGASAGSKNLLFTSGSGGGYVFITTDGPGLTAEVAGVGYLITNALLRDTSAFYHIVLRVDTTQGATANRLRFYINGVEPTYSDVTAQSISQNAAFALLANGVVQGIGGVAGVGHTVIGTDTTFAEVVFNDGQSYGPDSYGELKNGVWIPKDPSGLTFGNQGFHLNFASSGDLGNDVSGNNNDFATANLPAHDQLLSSPTFNSNSNGGNFAIYNRLSPTTNGAVFTEGNLKSSPASSWSATTYIKTTMAIPKDKKIYFEASDAGASGGLFSIGVARESGVPSGTNVGGAGSVTLYDESKYVNGIRTASWITSAPAGAIIQVAVDGSTGKVWLGYNNTWGGSGNPSAGSNEAGTITNTNNEDLLPVVCQNLNSNLVINFGQDGSFAGALSGGNIGTKTDATGYGAFKYSPPTDFLALCTGNLSVLDAIDPAQTEDNFPQELFNATLYTGNNSNQNINVGFKPDFVWLKSRSAAYNHFLFDSNRGVTKIIRSDGTNAESTTAESLKAFISTGFTYGDDATGNENNASMVSWNWRANGGTTSSDSSGSITSTVQVDPSGGFSIVKYIGANNNWSNPATVGHGLSSAPNCILLKALGAVDEWQCFFSDYGSVSTGGASAAHASLVLNSTSTLYTSQSYKGWGGVMPDADKFTVDGNNANGTESEGIIAYCFANTEGYIKSGSYVGNGNVNGSFVYTGFRPAFILAKSIDAAEAWLIADDNRPGYNATDQALKANNANVTASGSTYAIDILSNGFKARTAWEGWNQSGKTIVYLALAENPFKYALAR